MSRACAYDDPPRGMEYLARSAIGFCSHDKFSEVRSRAGLVVLAILHRVDALIVNFSRSMSPSSMPRLVYFRMAHPLSPISSYWVR